MYKLRKVKTASGKIAVQALLKGGHHHTVVHHFGSAGTAEELIRLETVAADWMKRKDPQSALFDNFYAPQAFQNTPPTGSEPLVSLEHLEHLGSQPRLLYDVVRQTIATCGFDSLVDPLIADLVCMRLIKPTSKIQSLRFLKEQLGISYSLRTLARRLKELGWEPTDAEKKANPNKTSLWSQVEAQAIAYARVHLSFTFSLVFYDVTTLYFESFQSDEDQTNEAGMVIQPGLKKPGFSKDNKFHQPQVVLGLLITPEGFPVKLEVFPGNTFEGHTFVPLLQSLKTAYQIQQLTVVADAAMLSDANIQQLEKLNIGYIVGARLGNLSRTTITEISTALNRQHEKTMRFESKTKGSLICSFSKTRYNKDKHETEKQVAKAKKLLETTSIPLKHSKFLTQSKQKEKQWTFHDDLLTKTKLLWGVKGYYTNQTDLSDKEIITYYHNLWKIEYDFRIAKTDLKIRPLFHHQSQTIKAHLVICFMALCISKHLERLTGISIHKIVDSLEKITDAVLRNTLTKEIHILRKTYPPEVKTLLKKINFAH